MLEKAIEMMGEGYLTNSQIVEDVARKYGLSALDVLTEKERRRETLDNLQIIMDCLTDTQRKVLSLTAQGYTVREMEDMMGRDKALITRERQSISKRLMKVADESRIKGLKSEISKILAKGKHSRKLERLLDEYNQRMEVREALKKLLVLLTPPESTKEMNGSVNLPAYSFEREMAVGTGMREGVEDGYHVMKTVTECHMPEYMADCFGDSSTCCMLCATCRRQKEMPGRSAGSSGGIWHTNDTTDGIKVVNPHSTFVHKIA